MHDMTYELQADHLPLLPCLLSHMNWLLNPLIISASFQFLHVGKDMLVPLPLHLPINHPYASTPLLLIMLRLPQLPIDMLPTLPSHLRPHESLRFHTPASSPLQLTILTLLRCPLMFSIDHPYAHTMLGFHSNS
ncbi:hypothetical protein O181_051730 [Austropuccinia psidii MF-1]|uniref:Uncharacterized protein n=1 Tax=Austropuccinia psidii MF-1 TaxID=1389203 RepID=A0A9Q3E3K1_9BASI|nr:hypothetical protein [Austropuccinia psidii MF-1]